MKKPIGIASITNKLDLSAVGPAHWAGERIWDRWQEEARPRVGATYQTQRTKVVEYIARLTGPLTILELCCGTGCLAYDLLDNENVTKLNAVDINPQAIAQLQKQLQEHPRSAILEASVANVLQIESWPDHGLYDVVICIDALPNLSWSALPAIFQHISTSLKPTGCFIGNYLSSEYIDAHTANKHGRLGYIRIYSRLILGKMLAYFYPALAGQKGMLRTGTIFKHDLLNLLEQFFKINHFETDVYHWFAANTKD